MEPIKVMPEKEQKTLWLVIWGILSFAGLAAGAVLTLVLDYPGNIILGLTTAVWLMVVVPVFLWIPAFYRSLEYVVEGDSIKAKKGVFWKKRVTVPYTKITNVDVTQGPVQRMFNIGTIHVQTAGAGGAQGMQAELRLLGVRELDGLRDVIMERVGRYAVSGREGEKTEVPMEGDSAIFGRMLKELRAIRKALERKRN